MRVLFTLIVVCSLSFISIDIIFAQSPTEFQFQVAC